MYTAKGQLDAGALLKQYSPLVRRLAHQMIAKLPANVELDDLIQVGMIGLSDALSRFDAAQGVQFETFATPAHPRRHARRAARQRLDEPRRPPPPALDRDRRAQAGAEAGRAPKERDRARDGPVAVEYQELLGKVRGTQLVYLEDMSGDEGDDDFLDRHVADTESNPLGRCRTSACARRWSRRSRTCPSASST
jgi:RNA polymerase sigma factor FliA